MGEIANAFSSKYVVNVICGPDVYDKSRKQVKNSSHPNNIKIYTANVKTYNKNSITGKALSFLSTSLSIYKLANKLIKDGDKVLMVTNPAPLVVLMGKLKRKRDFQWNILVHDVFPENTKATCISLPLFGIIKTIFDKAYSLADRLIVLGRDMANIMGQKTKGKVPISIIENWGDFDNIKPQPMPESNRMILQYAGNIGRVQGLENILAQLPDFIDFHIYGSGAFEKRLKDHDKPNVYFHGPYSRSEQSSILGKCHIGLVTLDERMYGLGTPSKTYNILASGRPVLYFGPKDSEIGLLIKENGLGFCDWPDKWDIEDIKKIGKRARAIGEKYYSKSVILNKFLDII